jgi:hypothetical protein
MIWKIVLHQDPESGRPTTFELNSAYGVSKQGTPDLVGGGTEVALTGTWERLTGASPDPEATVYQLNPDDASSPVSFLKVGDDIIHLLSSDGTLVVGNGAWAYTLDRMDEGIASQVDQSPVNPTQVPPRPPIPPTPAGESVFGIYDGRTPCDPVVLEFTNIPPSPDCRKIKWRLTLYEDRETGEPGTYLYMGTYSFAPGVWRILQGTPGDPEAVIYELTPDYSGQPAYFLKVGEDHLFALDEGLNPLVGNNQFSYTLSRMKKAATKPATSALAP